MENLRMKFEESRRTRIARVLQILYGIFFFAPAGFGCIFVIFSSPAVGIVAFVVNFLVHLGICKLIDYALDDGYSCTVRTSDGHTLELKTNSNIVAKNGEVNPVKNPYFIAAMDGSEVLRIDTVTSAGSSFEFDGKKYSFVGSEMEKGFSSFFRIDSIAVETLDQAPSVASGWLDEVSVDEAPAVENNKPATSFSSNDLRELKALLDDGIITEEEFNAKKKQMLGL